MNLVPIEFEFANALQKRDVTDLIIIHHSGNVNNADLGAERIHEMHLNNGWSGVGYHYIVRKNGDVETGRPVWAKGSHCEGENWHSIGIHLAGDFTNAVPEEAQLVALGQLLKALCTEWDIPLDRDHIVGHRDYNATACPGDQFYPMIDTIINAVNSVK